MKYLITFGICTYNRKDILLRSAKSLKSIDRYHEINVRIYDDCSTEYDKRFLQALFPEAKTIHVQKKNCGADKNTSIMYEDFLRSGDDLLFNADSDILYSKDIIHIIESMLDKTDGFFSVFNTPAHAVTGSAGSSMLAKKIVGAAGCCLTRETAGIILKNVTSRDKSFDTKMCEVLNAKGKRILTTKKSYVQHIGVVGQNTDFFSFDYGVGFDWDSVENARSIEDAFEKYILSIQKFKNTKIGKVYGILITLYRRIRKLEKCIKK